MKVCHEGQLLTLVGEGGQFDAIVVQVPHLVKVEVAAAQRRGVDAAVTRTCPGTRTTGK